MREGEACAISPTLNHSIPARQINLFLDAGGVPLSDFNGLNTSELMNHSAAAEVFTLAGVYGNAAAKRLSTPDRYRIIATPPRGSVAERALRGLTPIKADADGRFLVPGEGAGASMLCASVLVGGWGRVLLRCVKWRLTYCVL